MLFARARRDLFYWRGHGAVPQPTRISIEMPRMLRNPLCGTADGHLVRSVRVLRWQARKLPICDNWGLEDGDE